MKKLITVSLLILFCGCGGGGGGGGSEFVGAARILVSASPRSIDTGDRTHLEINLAEVHNDGIQLKIRYPEALAFVENSAKLSTIDDSDEEEDEDGGKLITPGTQINVDGDIYLVFYLAQNVFGEEDEGIVRLEFEGVDSKDDALIEVDPDVDANEQFNPENPEFASEGEVSVQIVRD